MTAAPLDLTGLPASGGARIVTFIHRYLLTPKGHGAREPMRLRPWQREIVHGLYRPGVRQGLVAMPRGNGKTTLAAAIALADLFAGGEGGRAYCCAADERQARLTFDTARRCVELNPELAEQVQVFQDRIYLPATDSILAPLPAEPHRLLGLDPTLVIVDELGSVSSEVYEALALASGKRAQSLLLAISTPATNRDGPMWSLVEHGRRGEDSSAFYFREYAAPDGCAIDDEEAWAVANPALGDFLSIDAMRATLRTTRAETFRQMRLGLWVGQVGSWLPWGLWESRADPTRAVEPGARIVAAFDGSASSDSTALIGATVEAEPHVFVLGLWEREDDPRWRVDRADVMARIHDVFDTYDVAELSMDVFGYRSEAEALALRYPGRVLEHPMNASRMGPAVDRTFVAINEAKMSHDGDERMARHVGHAVAKRSPFGDILQKDSRESVRKIDAAIGVVLALSRAQHHARVGVKKKRVASF